MGDKAVDSYGLDPVFEKSVAVLCASSPKFFGSVGHAIDPDALNSEVGRLIVKTAATIFKESGRGPAHPSILMQRLRRLSMEGSVTVKQINSVLDLLIETDVVAEADVVAEFAPVLRRRMHADVVRSSIDEYSKRTDFENVVAKIDKARRVGVQDASLGLRLGNDSFSEIDRIRRIHKLPLGIPELDAILGGGVPRGTQTLFIAASGGGKSMALSHAVARNLSYGMFCGYATLELPDTEVVARVKANLTGVPTSVIASGDFTAARAELEKMYPTLGTLLVQRFSPKHTTFADIRAWVKECEEAEGFPMDLLAIDYIDKLKGRNVKDNEYITQGEQAEEFRVFLEDHGKWGLTGSQATMKGRDSRKRIGITDVRDSSRKVDVADQVITLTKSPDGEMVEMFVGKNRYGISEVSTGPIPHDWERGRMCVL